MKTIAVWNHKGGVGKTAFSFFMGQLLALVGKYVLVIDNDPQNTLGFAYCGIPQDKDGMAQVYQGKKTILECIKVQREILIDGEATMGVVPGHATFEDMVQVKTMKNYDPVNLKRSLEDKELQEAFDYVIIDNNPGFHAPTQAAIKYCDEVFIPCIPTKADRVAVERSIELITKMEYGAKRKIKHIIPSPCLF